MYINAISLQPSFKIWLIQCYLGNCQYQEGITECSGTHLCVFWDRYIYTRAGMSQLYFIVIIFMGVIIHTQIAGVVIQSSSCGFYQVSCCLSWFGVHGFYTVQPADSLHQNLLDYWSFSKVPIAKRPWKVTSHPFSTMQQLLTAVNFSKHIFHLVL